jgi:short-subunit dehydrogenase
LKVRERAFSVLTKQCAVEFFEPFRTTSYIKGITMMNTIAIIGAGPLLGLSLAREFGRKDFKVALVARRKNGLEHLVSLLKEEQIETVGFAADVTDELQLQVAFEDIRKELGIIDVLIYNAAVIEPVMASQTTVEIANKHLQVDVLGGIASVQQVLPEMIERNHGTILFTGGGNSELSAIPFLTTLSIGKSGLRSYAHCLHDELANKGVFAGMLSIAGVIKKGTFFDPDKIAAVYYEMYEQRDCVERFYAEDKKDPVSQLRDTYKA